MFKCSFDEFVGEKVFSPSYSSAILAPPPLTLFIAFFEEEIVFEWDNDTYLLLSYFI